MVVRQECVLLKNNSGELQVRNVKEEDGRGKVSTKSDFKEGSGGCD